MKSRQTRREIRELLQRHDLRARKAYGQHFLADPNLVDKIVALAQVTAGDSVVEIGAGTGALTVALGATGARVVAYEVDDRLRPILDEVLGDADVEVRYEDVMSVDWRRALGDDTWKLVANLPYNVGTPLILDILMDVDAVERLTVMVQTEVADRLLAGPGSPDYGVPSVVVALTAELEERFEVPSQVFVPPPRVASSVVQLRRIPAPARAREAAEVARTAFGQRRKMLRRSLADLTSPERLAGAGISPAARPEELTPQDFLTIAGVVADG